MMHSRQRSFKVAIVCERVARHLSVLFLLPGRFERGQDFLATREISQTIGEPLSNVRRIWANICDPE